jgi:hypothetical protein
MTDFFCADFSRQAGEDIIGSATPFQTYILIECPTPWASEAFDSKLIPANLKDLITEIKQSQLSIRFLLIESKQLLPHSYTKLLIYDQNREEFSKGYSKREFNVETLEQVAGVVRNYLAGESVDCEEETRTTRDILVCTHGSHDKCCARYGNPFYAKAVATVSELNLHQVRIWKASHFGGHRFAPTAIDLPEGRYYGVLNHESLQSILMRTGEVECFNKVYRGWGILPTQIQVLERELILRYGWNWFNYKVVGKIIEQNAEKTVIQAEIRFEKPDGSIWNYRADLLKDENNTLCLKGSCNASKEFEFVKYSVENLEGYLEKQNSYLYSPKVDKSKYMNKCGMSK